MFLAIVTAFAIDPINLILALILGLTIRSKSILTGAAVVGGLGLAGLRHLLNPYSTLGGFEMVAALIIALLIPSLLLNALAEYRRRKRGDGPNSASRDDKQAA